MNFKQLSVLLLATSLVIVPSGRADVDVGLDLDDSDILGISDPGPGTTATMSKEDAAIQKKSKSGKKVERKKRETPKKASEKKSKSGKKIERKKRETPNKASGKSKKSKSKTSKRSPKAEKKVAMKKDKTKVAKLGKFDKKGDIKSFKKSANALIDFMKNTEKVTAKEKFDLYMAVGRFSWATGRKKGFDTKEHYNVTINLLQNAVSHKNLFTSTRMKFINKWLTSKKTELANFDAKKKAKADKKAVKAKKVRKSKKTSAKQKSDAKRSTTLDRD